MEGERDGGRGASTEKPPHNQNEIKTKIRVPWKNMLFTVIICGVTPNR